MAVMPIAKGVVPDRFYPAVLRALLDRFRRGSRALALVLMGRLAQLSLGAQMIDLLGHVRADPR